MSQSTLGKLLEKRLQSFNKKESAIYLLGMIDLSQIIVLGLNNELMMIINNQPTNRQKVKAILETLQFTSDEVEELLQAIYE